MILPLISPEQSTILEGIRAGHNLQIDAVAGSGKTTTSLYIASKNPDKNILLLTYNARLKMETRAKVVNLSLTNMEVHSYHAFCVRYFDPKAFTDAGILAFLNKKKKVRSEFSYDLVIVDEAQDMNPLYYHLVRHILDHCKDPQIVVMGDRKQSIYGFNRADPRFLTLAPALFPSPREWTRATLSTSYRITRPMAALVSDCCRGALPIRSVKNGSPVRYVVCGMYGARPVKEIEYYLKKGFAHEDIFVLAASVRCSKSPVRVLANRLTEKGVPIYVPTSDEERLDEEVLRNKIVFSTFHQVKGLERAVVLVFDFSDNYFKYYGKNLPLHEIPNTIYVAITRGRIGLTVFHDDTSPYFSFLDRARLADCCTVEKTKRFREDRVLSLDVSPHSVVKKEMPMAELVRYLPVDVLQACLGALSIQRIKEKGAPLDVPLVSRQGDDSHESVGEINSIAIPSYFEWKRTGRMTIGEYLRGESVSLLTTTTMTVERLLKMSTRWAAQKSGYDFKSSQIKTFDWLEQSMLDEAVERLTECFPDASPLEFEKSARVADWDSEWEFTGFVDVWDSAKSEMWEVKMVSELGPEHFLQAALHSWLLRTSGIFVEKTRLYNIIDKETYDVAWVSWGQADAQVRRLVEYKKSSKNVKSDDEFIASLRKK